MEVDRKKGQVTLFVILGIIIVVGVISFFVFRENSFFSSSKKSNLVHDSYLVCIQDLAWEAVSILGASGGYIEVPSYEAGSGYMPSSSQLNFLGTAVPYWFYVSGNNIAREQIPTLGDMEREIETYISQNIQKCDFSDFEKQGYLVDVDSGTVAANIKESSVEISVRSNMRIFFEEDVISMRDHNTKIDSRIGKYYHLAKDIYKFQAEEYFLESYALDVLQTSAPTTGVELTCSPMFFNFAEIKKNISEALSQNTPYIKLKGNYYDSSKANKYFVRDAGVNIVENVNFLYMGDWPTKIEIYGDEVAQPMGLQEGMAMLGFCYVPYHLVYDINFPVMIQIFDEKETFQFPISVIIKKNQPREAIYSGDYENYEVDVCKNRIQDLRVSTIDINQLPVEADIYFSCLNDGCSLGQTKISSGGARLNTLAPICVNAILSASAEGYAKDSIYISTNEEFEARLILRKKYSINLDLGNIVGSAVVSFEGEGYSTTAMYPEQNSVELVEGFYNISVYLFGNSSLVLPSYTEKTCIEVPSSGIGGLFGSSKNNCFETVIPEQKIEGALVGGGSAFDYFTESELRESRKLNLNIPLFPMPTKIEDLSENYIKLEDSFVDVNFVK